MVRQTYGKSEGYSFVTGRDSIFARTGVIRGEVRTEPLFVKLFIGAGTERRNRQIDIEATFRAMNTLVFIGLVRVTRDFFIDKSSMVFFARFVVVPIKAMAKCFGNPAKKEKKTETECQPAFHTRFQRNDSVVRCQP